MKLIFYMPINIKFSQKLVLLILVGMIKHAQIAQNSKVAKSLQYLKNKVRDEANLSNFSIN